LAFLRVFPKKSFGADLITSIGVADYGNMPIDENAWVNREGREAGTKIFLHWAGRFPSCSSLFVVKNSRMGIFRKMKNSFT
jgi:hypothetical protein